MALLLPLCQHLFKNAIDLLVKAGRHVLIGIRDFDSGLFNAFVSAVQALNVPLKRLNIQFRK